jgi:hypothetical protein
MYEWTSRLKEGSLVATAVDLPMQQYVAATVPGCGVQ